MPLSRILGYYCLMLLLCTVAFGHWTPPQPETLDTQNEQTVGDVARPVPGFYEARQHQIALLHIDHRR